MLVWWLVAITNVLVQGKFFDYHYLPLLAPASLLTGLGLGSILSLVFARVKRPGPRALVCSAGLVLLFALTPIGLKLLDVARVAFTSDTVEEYIAGRREHAFPAYNVMEIREVAAEVERMTTAEQRVFLWGFEPTINVRAQRHTVSRFLYNFPFRIESGQASYRSELMSALEARPPEVFIVASGDRYPGLTGTYKDSAQLMREFESLNDFVVGRYQKAGRVGRYTLWRLRE